MISRSLACCRWWSSRPQQLRYCRCVKAFSSTITSSSSSSKHKPAEVDIQLVEVGPRDGLQNERQPVSVQDKVTLIEKLVQAGCTRIEAGSFVSPKAVPAMADTPQVMEQLLNHSILGPHSNRAPVRISCLVPNVKYLQQALLYQPDEIAIFASASETFSQKNIQCSIAESLERFRDMVQHISSHTESSSSSVRLRGYVSCVMACPYEGAVNPVAVARVTEQLLDLGCHEVSLGDTIGVGTPKATQRMLHEVLVATGNRPQALAVHFHDT